MICAAVHLLLVRVPVCEQQIFTSKVAVTQACYLISALFCTTALTVRDALCHDLCYSALLLVIVPLSESVCEQQTFTSKLAVKHSCCQAVVCTAALISEGCTLA